jgi:predicted site-specific integrase-resolvase
MSEAKEISEFLLTKLSTLARDGVSVIEAAEWLNKSGKLSGVNHAQKRLRDLLREGKIKGAYQFPNKRWVIVNRSRLPDGIQRVVPIKEAVKILKISEPRLRRFTQEGKLKSLEFGPAVFVFLEDEIKEFQRKYVERSYGTIIPGVPPSQNTELEKLRRQLYYLRSDFRLIVERIEEMIRLLE